MQSTALSFEEQAMLDVMESQGFKYIPKSEKYEGFGELINPEGYALLVENVRDAFIDYESYFNHGRAKFGIRRA